MPVTPVGLRYDTITANGLISTLTTATAIVAANTKRRKLVVLNSHATMTLYLGGSAVSASTYAWRLTAGQSLDLGPFTGALYGSGSSTATTTVFFEGYSSNA